MAQLSVAIDVMVAQRHNYDINYGEN